MEEQELISVIMPVYNAKDYLEESVETVRNQVWQNLELILVDDGSTDGSRELCDELAHKDSRIRVFHLKNGGVSRARNYGLQKAVGDYITFIDADDGMKIGLIAILYRMLIEYGADIAVCGHEECISGERTIPKFGTKEIHSWLGANIMKEFLTGNRIGWTVWGKLFRRECIENISFLPGLTIGEDMYFVFQACRQSQRLCLYDACLYQYRIRDGSAMQNKLSDKNFAVYELIRKVYEEVKYSNWEYKEMADIFFIKQTIWHMKFFMMRLEKGSSYTTWIEIMRAGIKVYPVKEVKRLLTKKQLLEFILITKFPEIFRYYMKVYQNVYTLLRT